MGDLKVVDIEAFGARYRVSADPDTEQRIRKAVDYLEKKVENASNELNKPLTEPVPAQVFFAALGIAEELHMLREQVEDDRQSQRTEIARIGRLVDRSLISKFVKIRMAYGAERQEKT